MTRPNRTRRSRLSVTGKGVKLSLALRPRQISIWLCKYFVRFVKLGRRSNGLCPRPILSTSNSRTFRNVILLRGTVQFLHRLLSARQTDRVSGQNTALETSLSYGLGSWTLRLPRIWPCVTTRQIVICRAVSLCREIGSLCRTPRNARWTLRCLLHL